METQTETEFTLWTAVALATRTGITLRQAEKLIYGRLIPVVKVQGRVYVRPADVRAYLAANTSEVA